MFESRNFLQMIFISYATVQTNRIHNIAEKLPSSITFIAVTL